MYQILSVGGGEIAEQLSRSSAADFGLRGELPYIDAVIAANPRAVEDYKNGKVKAIQALFGACMKELRGAGDPAVIKERLTNKLS